LANGDVGVLWRNADGTLHAYLPDEQGGLRAFHPSRIPPHATSWAMTIHKSQGSEFSEVTVVLPAVDSPILSRDLLYTGVTRARRAVHIVGDENIIRDCVGRRTERSSGLADALRLS
jgi:exodeoxyribonuclease V alpha subunit